MSRTYQGRDPRGGTAQKTSKQTQWVNFGELTTKRKINQTESSTSVPSEENEGSDEDDSDEWLHPTCECNAGMIADAPSDKEYEDALNTLCAGVRLELWWKPLDTWCRGLVTKCRKDNSFVKVRCKLEDGRLDHKWYHTKHTKFKNIKAPIAQGNNSWVAEDRRDVKSNLQECNSPEITKKSRRNKKSKWPSFLSPYFQKSDISKSVKGKWGQKLRWKQNRAELTLTNVYGLRVAVTTGEEETKRALERIRSCMYNLIH